MSSFISKFIIVLRSLQFLFAVMYFPLVVVLSTRDGAKFVTGYIVLGLLASILTLYLCVSALSQLWRWKANHVPSNCEKILNLTLETLALVLWLLVIIDDSFEWGAPNVEKLQQSLDTGRVNVVWVFLIVLSFSSLIAFGLTVVLSFADEFIQWQSKKKKHAVEERLGRSAIQVKISRDSSVSHDATCYPAVV